MTAATASAVSNSTSAAKDARPGRATADAAERQHRIGDFLEAGDIGTLHIIDITVALVAMGQAAFVDAVHDVLEHLLQLTLAPAATTAVLAHFETRHRDAAGIGRLARREHDFGMFERM